ncbi:MAG TPA: site-specific integrase [Candidatus Scatomorpha gallistercoris]|nr:site-specific integrase [Candidatus Scatomorpha gallistercoris]
MARKATSEKRRDNKNRVLRTGESQRKDGRYVYNYIDTFGNPQSVYSWKLVPTDKIPAGKRKDISLREKEEEIQKDIFDGIDTIGKKMTVCQLYAKQIRHRANVKEGTKQGRGQLMRILKEDELGACPIEKVKLSDAKEWALRMKENGYAYKTINNHKRSLKAAFYTAIQDDCIRKNPFNFQLSTVLEDDTEPKVPLSPTQEASFLSFVQNDKVYQKYYDEIIILLKTGLRISEFCGLTDTDINFDTRLVNVDHQLLKISGSYYVDTPKTKSGVRQVPMCTMVCEAFERVLKKRRQAAPIIVGGYSRFLFLNQKGLPKVAADYQSMFRRLVKKYNKCHAEPLPKVMTPHTLRHTFCTNLANAGMNPKALQYIMGHSNINMTLNYYAHATPDNAIAEMERLIA